MSIIVCLALLVAWSVFVCPFVNSIIRYYKRMLRQWQNALREEREKEDQDKYIGSLEKWY